MKILLDECLPIRLRKEFGDHEVMTVRYMGWTSLQNGNLLQQAEKHFDVFITGDTKLSFQQNLDHFDLAIIVIEVPVNDLPHLLPLVPKIRQIL